MQIKKADTLFDFFDKWSSRPNRYHHKFAVLISDTCRQNDLGITAANGTKYLEIRLSVLYFVLLFFNSHFLQIQSWQKILLSSQNAPQFNVQSAAAKPRVINLTVKHLFIN